MKLSQSILFAVVEAITA